MPHPPAPEIDAAYALHPEPLQGVLRQLRDIILEVAGDTPGVGEIEEALKWGQPSFLTVKPKTGSTIRLGSGGKGAPDKAALFVHCQTTLIEAFRGMHGDSLTFEGKRAVLLETDKALPVAALKECIALALTYHLNRRKGALTVGRFGPASGA